LIDKATITTGQGCASGSLTSNICISLMATGSACTKRTFD